VYTPPVIVRAMLDWAQSVRTPDRVIEPGAGSGRFLLAAASRFPKATLIGVETDPLAALLARGALAAAGVAKRATIIRADFRSVQFDQIDGKTLYIGNPPYVRHHLIAPSWKAWLRDQSQRMGLKASTLAGLHVYFFLAIARWAKAGDYGALITASEWLDVNYGQLVRDLFLDRLGGKSVFVIEPKAEPFPGTASTGAVTTFTVNGKPPSARFSRIMSLPELGDLSGGNVVHRERLVAERRWSRFVGAAHNFPEGYVELGELCRVHRGAVTGMNRVWIAGVHSEGLPDGVLFATVTKARELIRAGVSLDDDAVLRRVIDLPVDLSIFGKTDRAAIDKFLGRARQMGAKEGYVATYRRAWWSVGLRAPAPILATYMARRPPSFVRNLAGARHINIAHGLYPREPMSDAVLSGLVSFLRAGTTVQGGRIYSGGLTKFEPREMERIPVPEPPLLATMGKA
jgi:adenine-specific DNA-methyltransferase